MSQRLCALVGVLFLSVAGLALGETYGAWLRGAGAATGDLTVVYAPWLGFERTDASGNGGHHGGYEGELLLKGTPALLQHLPLRVRVRFAAVPQDHIDEVTPVCHTGNDELWRQTGGASTGGWWTTTAHSNASPARAMQRLPQVRPDTAIGPTLAEVVTVVTALTNGIGCVPFGFPSRNEFCWRDTPSSRVVARCDVMDAAGHTLAREVVPRFQQIAYGGYGQQAWVTGDAEADRLLREQCGYGAMETVTVLPALDAAYEGVPAIWVSHEAWGAAFDGARFWQRRLLQGVSLFGRADTVQTMQAALDPETNRVLLAAQLAAPAPAAMKNQNAQCAARLGEGLDIQMENSTGNGNRARREESRFENARGMFVHARAYRVWSSIVLGLFTVGTVVLLALAFVRLRGVRRIALWWALPLWAVAFALLGGALGRLVLPRRARADITEYRYAHLRWPDMYCKAYGRMLRFDGRAHAWRLPPAAMESAPIPSPSYLQHTMRAMEHRREQTPDRVRIADAGVRPGLSSSVCAAWFRPRSLPFDVTEGAEGRRLRATTDLAAVFVWSHGKWHGGHSLASGQDMFLNFTTVPGQDRLPGLPVTLAANWSRGATAMNPYAAQNCDDSAAPPAPATAALNTVLVVALQRAPSEARPEDARAESRVVWVVQCP